MSENSQIAKLNNMAQYYTEFFIAQNQEVLDELLEDCKNINVKINDVCIEFWYKEWIVARYRFAVVPIGAIINYFAVSEILHIGDWIDELTEYMEENQYTWNAKIQESKISRFRPAEELC